MNKKIRSLTVCGAAIFLSLLVSSAWGYEKEIEQLSSQLAEKIAGKGKKTVAVVDFTDLEGNVTQLDQFIAEEFSVALAGTDKGFRVIDRTRLKSIIKENKFAATGLIDPATASKLGKIAGVDALVTGTLTPFGDTVHLTVKVLDSDTADVIDSAKGDIAKTPAINRPLV
jgi:TolB-like protein